MSYVFRHKPEHIGIELDPYGWTAISILIDKLNITIEDLTYVVENSSKKRFSISDDGTLIRANQGHSVKINLDLAIKTPPSILYHGTTLAHYERIKVEGLSKMSRNHVHLSEDINTAKQVGSRHGKPIILKIESGQMHIDKLNFYQSENGVWLTEYVAPHYITLNEVG